ncbi:pyridoxamine 5'-phosphate oxidase family protein [Mycolicibacterium palauense]|uniref:pyridoxamine 5'-phosphate oxidase family protein n=1 Tax=Mycolicibacterium palauense TaxID=2034511 RepID=UPI000BFF073E|nr:pyridoxamine 5'-phosphate oxidase family protein [Mycolicibacterium palauense]
MNDDGRRAAGGFHGGELTVQQRAGVQAQAARLAPMVAAGQLRSGIAAFVAGAMFAAITARDRAGRLWTSPLLGPPGFLHAVGPTTLGLGAALPEGDPLHALPAGQPAGIVVVDFVTRRRVRINGVLTGATPEGLTVEVEQAYGNCPQYIRRRQVRATATSGTARARTHRGEALRPGDTRFVESADTFILGTTHPESGNDASHRGGPAGFVRTGPAHLWWPDYPGNNMFNSLGNLAVDPTAALLFLDFEAGAALQLSGEATVCWNADIADDTPAGRWVRFTPHLVVATAVPERPDRPTTHDRPNITNNGWRHHV